MIKLADRLLLVGVIIDEDIEKLLLMIDPETWDPTFSKGNLKNPSLSKTFIKLLMIFQRVKMNIAKDFLQ